MRVHSALQRAFPHGQLRKTAAIDLRGRPVRRHGGRNGRFSFRVRVINSFAASVYIHFAATGRSVGRPFDARIHHFTILLA